MLLILACYGSDEATKSTEKVDEELRWAVLQVSEWKPVWETARDFSVLIASDEKGNELLRTTSSDRGDQFYCVRANGYRIGQSTTVENIVISLKPEEDLFQHFLPCFKNKFKQNESLGVMQCWMILLYHDSFERFINQEIKYEKNERSLKFETTEGGYSSSFWNKMEISLGNKPFSIDRCQIVQPTKETWTVKNNQVHRLPKRQMSDFVETIGCTKEVREFFKEEAMGE